MSKGRTCMIQCGGGSGAGWGGMQDLPQKPGPARGWSQAGSRYPVRKHTPPAWRSRRPPQLSGQGTRSQWPNASSCTAASPRLPSRPCRRVPHGAGRAPTPSALPPRAAPPRPPWQKRASCLAIPLRAAMQKGHCGAQEGQFRGRPRLNRHGRRFRLL